MIKIGDKVLITKSEGTIYHHLKVGSVATVVALKEGGSYLLNGYTNGQDSDGHCAQYVDRECFVPVEDVKVDDIVRIITTKEPDNNVKHFYDIGTTAVVEEVFGKDRYEVVKKENGHRQIVTREDFQVLTKGYDPVTAFVPEKTVITKNFRVGDTVKISTKSQHYLLTEDPTTSDNPPNIRGTIISIDTGYDRHNIAVDWSNGRKNVYSDKDLVILKKAWHDKV